MLTLKTYAHAIREEEADLSFADFEEIDGSERLYPAPASNLEDENQNAPDLTGRGRSGILEHETRFELATPTLAMLSGGPKVLGYSVSAIAGVDKIQPIVFSSALPQGAAPRRCVSVPAWQSQGDFPTG